MVSEVLTYFIYLHKTRSSTRFKLSENKLCVVAIKFNFQYLRSNMKVLNFPECSSNTAPAESDMFRHCTANYLQSSKQRPNCDV